MNILTEIERLRGVVGGLERDIEGRRGRLQGQVRRVRDIAEKRARVVTDRAEREVERIEKRVGKVLGVVKGRADALSASVMGLIDGLRVARVRLQGDDSYRQAWDRVEVLETHSLEFMRVTVTLRAPSYRRSRMELQIVVDGGRLEYYIRARLGLGWAGVLVTRRFGLREEALTWLRRNRVRLLQPVRDLDAAMGMVAGQYAEAAADVDLRHVWEIWSRENDVRVTRRTVRYRTGDNLVVVKHVGGDRFLVTYTGSLDVAKLRADMVTHLQHGVMYFRAPVVEVSVYSRL